MATISKRARFWIYVIERVNDVLWKFGLMVIPAHDYIATAHLDKRAFYRIGWEDGYWTAITEYVQKNGDC